MAYTHPIHAAALTFSTEVEGNQGHAITKNAAARNGTNRALTIEDLVYVRNCLVRDNVVPASNFEMHKLHSAPNPYIASAAAPAICMVIKDGMRHFGVDKDVLLNQIQNVPAVDKQMYSVRMKAVLNKNARHNWNVADKIVRADIPNGINTTYNFRQTFLSEAKILRDALTNIGSRYGFSGRNMDTLKNLYAEANIYYKDEYKKNHFCGISYHGDAERPNSPVIGCSFGATRFLSFRAFQKNRYYPAGTETRIELEHGDIYFMSSAAVGSNWKKNSLITYRHRAGSLRFLEKDDKDRNRRWELRDRKKAAKEAREAVPKRKSPAPTPKRKAPPMVEVTDYTETVIKNGKRYKRCVTYVPLVDLTVED